ncbi:MAG: helix-turn-helix domain-containing protein [Acidimicrobiales bacterium]
MQLELQRIIAANLLAHRKALGLTQDRFAERIGKKRQFVQAVEAGRQNLRLSTIEGVAIELGIPPHSLLVPRPSEEPLSSIEGALTGEEGAVRDSV